MTTRTTPAGSTPPTSIASPILPEDASLHRTGGVASEAHPEAAAWLQGLVPPGPVRAGPFKGLETFVAEAGVGSDVNTVATVDVMRFIEQADPPLPRKEIEVVDQVWKNNDRAHSQRCYEAISFRALLERIPQVAAMTPKQRETAKVLIVSLDGHLSFMPLNMALSSSAPSDNKEGYGFVALRDLAAPEGQKWVSIPRSGKPPADPGPAYLVWTGGPCKTNTVFWPYQIKEIRILVPTEAPLPTAKG